jgi:hypothetical protein
MSTLVIEVDAISELALQITLAVLGANEETQRIEDDESGPLALASALSDFFELAAALEKGAVWLDTSDLSEFGAYGLELLDRLASQTRRLDILDQRENLSRVYPALAVWLARRDAVLDNLEGTADGFAMLANGLEDPRELADLCQLMEEVLQVASEEQERDEDKSNPWRPWRVLNLNEGIVATRSLDPELMDRTFENLGRRLPGDMPGFFADGRRQLDAQDVPEAVRDVMRRYADKWPTPSLH